MAKPPKDIRARARVHTECAIEKLVDLLADHDVTASTQLSAAKLLLELAYGRPAPRDGRPPDEEPEKAPPAEELTPREIRQLDREFHGEDHFRFLRKVNQRFRPSRSQRKQGEQERARERAAKKEAAQAEN